jgi:DNA-binding HxlR family transcriptional regulator
MNTAKPFARSICAIANSLDIVGDKWSLLVVRDLLHGKRTYGELAQ